MKQEMWGEEHFLVRYEMWLVSCVWRVRNEE
jgi:hypothetical protein